MAKMMRLAVRSRYRLLLLALATLFVCSLLPGITQFSISTTSLRQWTTVISGWWEQNRGSQGGSQVPLEYEEIDFSRWKDPNAAPIKKTYKPAPEPALPVRDPFPLLSQNPPPSRSLLQAPKANRPPRRHYPEQTPLFVGFTRNWPQLLQCVVSYIAAGWPAEDIYVVENTGVVYANRESKLTLQNPFYLNHTQLAMLGVNVIITPTLLTFSQLQNFYLWTALERAHPHFFWTHQDLLVLSYENETTTTGTLYDNAVSILRHLTTTTPTTPNTSSSSESKNKKKWAHHFFAYDHLTLVNRDAVLSVGGWDTHIPFYTSDCDTYLRLRWAGFAQGESDMVGLILDVGSVLADLGALFRIGGARARVADYSSSGSSGLLSSSSGRGVESSSSSSFSSGAAVQGGDEDYVESWERLVEVGERMERDKYAGGNSLRNTWQGQQRGGQGEPFYRDADGFETGVQLMIDAGRSVFAEKWGHRGCGLDGTGMTGEDAWRLEKDWDEELEGRGFEGGSW